MERNFDYVMHNFSNGNNTVNWLFAIEHFFGKEQTDAFCEYFIHANRILRKNDIRNLLSSYSLSVFSLMGTEQLAFLSIYRPFDSTSPLLTKLENGPEKMQAFIQQKQVQFSKAIKKLGYSYSVIPGNWVDKHRKATYQREYVFAIYSEMDSPEQFTQNIISLANQYDISSVLLTEPLADNQPKRQIKSQLWDVLSKTVIAESADTTIETIESFLSSLHNTKLVFSIPYEKNKTVWNANLSYLADYYSPIKQEKVKTARVSSCNMGMLKQSLLMSFQRKDYNG